MQKAGFLLWILVCGILILDIGNGYVRAQDSSDRIKTQEVDIVNSSGATVIQIIDTEIGPMINLNDPSGSLRMAGDAEKIGGGMAFEDAKSHDIALLGGIDSKDGPQDTLIIDPPGQSNTILTVRNNYDGLSILDKTGKERVAIGYNPASPVPVFATESADSKAGIFAGIYGKKAHVLFHDPTGTARLDLGVDLDNNAYFALGGKDGTASWNKTFDADGSPATFGGDTSGAGDSDSGSDNAIRRNGSP